ncbi:hypothetical protein C0989_004499 [Termitomyces sp. Mn162]|nr:hypothetical protein C0989_004499 [Termitomyces sp. Mn162]
MNDQEVIEISSGESDAEPSIDRRAALQPVISRVVDALGGYERGTYRMGDEVNGCLKDLKKLWRKDDTDDERTVARIFWETRVLPNDLVPILLETAGKGLVEDKRAIACADLMTAMTWPIDMAEELKELDDELDKGTDYTHLLESHLYYKVALLKPGVMQALFGIVLPPLSKTPKERQERDGQIVNVVLHLVRNLAFIKDLPYNTHLSADQAEFSSLQAKLIQTLSETHVLQLLLTVAVNTDNDPLFNSWNTLVLEIFYLLFRGVKPRNLSNDQAKQPTETLQRLLAAEDRTRRELARKANSRHSRFGTTVAVKLNPNRKVKPAGENDNGNDADSEADPGSSRSFILHRQQAISSESGSIMDITKRQMSKKSNKVDEMAREDHLSVEARVVLQNLAIEFTEACFNPFLSALLKDIRSERAKITEKDNLRLLFVTKWFLEFFLSMRAKEKAQGNQGRWDFGLIAEVTERTWIVWVLKRMREAVEEKPKLWTELQTGTECLTQLLLLIDAMSSADITDPDLKEAADVLQQQLIYNGEVLDIAFESLRSYKLGTQSLVYLDSSVYLAYALLKMLEKWSKSKGGDVYVRKRKAKKCKSIKGMGEDDGIPDVEEEPAEEEEVVHETMFTFEAFEMKFAHADITHTLLTYLARYKDFSSPENMRRVVSLMHRQAVRVKAEGLFFKVSTLNLFKTLLADQKSFPRDQPYKDLVNLITFILRQFFKALAEEPFLAVEAFFPKNRGHWKQYSSWEPEKSGKERKVAEDTIFPRDVEVKKGYSWSDQLGITIASLVESGERELVDWTRDILTVVITQRQRIIDETDTQDGTISDDNDDPDAEATKALRLKGPSEEAMAKITDYLIPYLSDEQANAATKQPHLKLLFRLCKFQILNDVRAYKSDADELEWYVPVAVAPADLRSTLTVIDQFLATPIDLEGKKASELFGKKRRRRRRRRSPSSEPGNDSVLDDDEPRKKKREKKNKEKQQYKSAQFIEDSDEEYGNIEAFLEKEKAMREKAQRAAEALGVQINNMKAQGTRKRRRKTGSDSRNKRHKGDDAANATGYEGTDGGTEEDDDDSVGEVDDHNDPSLSPPRPKPRPLGKRPSYPSPSPQHFPDTTENDEPSPTTKMIRTASKRKRLVVSDEDD